MVWLQLISCATWLHVSPGKFIIRAMHWTTSAEMAITTQAPARFLLILLNIASLMVRVTCRPRLSSAQGSLLSTDGCKSLFCRLAC